MKGIFENSIHLDSYWDITTTYSIFEIMMPDGRYIMWTWDNNHKLEDKCVWHL